MFREFGIPARIEKVETIERLEELRKKHTNVNNCYISVYAFNEGIDAKTVYDSAVITTLWFDFDHNTDVSKCLKDVRKLYNRYCIPRNVTPRIFFTGGRGFQLNIDFPLPIDIPQELKRKSIRDYLMFLKKEYVLTTLDTQCVNNSVSCMRRMSNTPYLNKKTKEPSGKYCIQLEIEEMLDYTMDEILELSRWPRIRPFEYPGLHNEQAMMSFLFFICDELEIPHRPTNSVEYLLSQIYQGKDKFANEYNNSSEIVNYLPIRKCISNLINNSIEGGHCGHSENTAIATELIGAGWKDNDIAFVFQAIFNEPGERYGWYTDNGHAGYQIKNIRAKAINRFSKNRLMQLNVCGNKYCGCGG